MSAGSVNAKTKLVALFIIATLVMGSLAVALPLASPENNNQSKLKMYADAAGAVELTKKDGTYVVKTGDQVHLQLVGLSDNSIMASGTTQNGETEVLVHASINGKNYDIIFLQVMVQNGNSEIFPWTVGDFSSDGLYKSTDPNDSAILCDTSGLVMYGKIRSTGLRELFEAAKSQPDFRGYCGPTNSSSTDGSAQGTSTNSQDVNYYCTSDRIRGGIKIIDETTYVEFDRCQIDGKIEIKNSNVGLTDSIVKGDIESKKSLLDIEGGQVKGNIDIKGGSLHVEGGQINGNVHVEGASLYLGHNTVINGNLECKNSEYNIYDTIVKGNVKGCKLNQSSGSSDNNNNSSVLDNFPFCTTTGNLKVCTDKHDYSPNETVHIAGSGFDSNTNLLMRVIRPDGSVVTGDGSFGSWPTSYDSINTNANGILRYDYVLDGIKGEYLVQVLQRGIVIATHKFLDDAGTPSGTTATYNLTTQQLTVSGTYNNAPCGDDKKVGFAIFINGANPVTPGTGSLDGVNTNTMHLVSSSSCATSGSWGPDTHSLPSAPNTVCVVIYDVKSSKFNSSGKHSGIPAGSMRNTDNSFEEGNNDDDDDGNGSYPPNSCTNPTIIGGPQTGSITIVKEANPDDAQDFSFTGSNGIGTFMLDDDSDGTLPKQKTFSNLQPGTYSVSEAPVAGWTLTSATCSDNSPVNNIQLSAGENITCTFVNTKLGVEKGSITIKKDAVPDDPQNFSFTGSNGIGTFMLDDDGSNTNILSNMATFSNLAPGTYSISETPVAGWTLTSATCSDGSPVNNIQLSAGENITCTFTNTKLDQQRGTIKIIKDTIPDDPQDFSFTTTGGLTPSTFTLDDDGTQNNPLSNTQIYSNVVPGAYTVTETAVPGFHTTVLCADPNDSSGPSRPAFANTNVATIGLDPGETVTCTFTNEKELPPPPTAELTVFKFFDRDGDGLRDQTCNNVPSHSASLLMPDPGCVFTEEPLSGFGMKVFDQTGFILIVEKFTDANGNAVFILPGNKVFIIRENFPPAPDNCQWVQTFPGPLANLQHKVTLAPDERKTVVFGNKLKCPIPTEPLAKLQVFKFLDANGNGIRDQNEGGLPNFGIKIFDQTGVTLIIEKFTDQTGHVVFDLAGNTVFIVRENFPPAPDNCQWVQTFPGAIGGLQHKITLLPGDDQTVIFLNKLKCPQPIQPPAKLQVFKFRDDNGNGRWDFTDTNGNGIKDTSEPGEPPLAGVKMILKDAFGQLVGSILTDASGHAMFDQLTPGGYTVAEDISSLPVTCTGGKWIQTFPGSSSNFVHNVTLLVGDDQTVLFGDKLNCPTLTELTVTKFFDADGDGFQGPNEGGLAGFTIEIKDQTGSQLIASKVTGADGKAVFNILPGTIIVREIPPPVPQNCLAGSWIQTSPGAPAFEHKVTISSGELQKDLKFGNKLDCPNVGKLTVSKYNDKNGNGVRDIGEPALQGFLIKVYDGSNNIVVSAKTDANGQVMFILPGGQSFTVREDVFSGPVPLDCRNGQWTQTSPGAPDFSIPATIPNRDPMSQVPNEVKKEFGNKLSCFVAPAMLIVHKFHDDNHDGVQNNSESALSGFNIRIFNTQMQLIAQAKTDTTGTAMFTIAPGTYKVFEDFRVVMPTECVGGRWVQTSPGNDVQPNPLVASMAMNSITITLGEGEAKHIKFGNYLDCPIQKDP